MRVLTGLQEARPLFQDRLPIMGSEADRQIVTEVVHAVKTEGDAALRRYSERFDHVTLDDWRVPLQAFDGAIRQVPAELRDAIALAANRVRTYYHHQPREGFLHQADGALLGQIVRPLERVACYVPAGTAPLFSTILMTAVPAQVAGVPDIVIASPPRRDGTVAPEILVTALELGIDTVYRIGGAQAIAALAYGTETIRRVDKIVGPGNRFVVLAKAAVYGTVGIESLPGPTETLVLADETADVAHVAADLLAQAEHLDAQPILVTTSDTLIEQLKDELDRQLADLSTAAFAREALEQRGYIVRVETLEEGVEVANLYAPEHLCLLVRDPWSLIPNVKHAGGLFVGAYSMEALGDYILGPSHVMPTGGTARFSSAVNIRDFQKVIPLVSVQPSLLTHVGPAGARMARAEGLEAHARAIESRLVPEVSD